MVTLNSLMDSRRLLSSPNASEHPLLNTNISALIVLLFMLLFVILYISCHLHRFCILNTPFHFNTTARGANLTTTTTRMHFSPALNLPPPQGLDVKLVESLPKVIFNSSTLILLTPNHEDRQKQEERESCVICLDEFKDEETLLLIPFCAHLFHPQCIKAWLNTHTTCPLCRHSLTTLQLHHPSALTESAPSLESTNLQGELCQMERRRHSMDHSQLLMGRGKDTSHLFHPFLSNAIWGISDTPSSSNADYPAMEDKLGSSVSAGDLKRSNSDRFMTRKDEEGSSSLIDKHRKLTRFASDRYGYRVPWRSEEE